MTVRCWVHVYTFKRGSQQKYSDNIIFYLSFCLWDYWLSQQTYTCQTSTVPMNQAPAKTTKNLCYLSICIWYKKKKKIKVWAWQVPVYCSVGHCQPFGTCTQQSGQQYHQSLFRLQMETRMAGLSRRQDEVPRTLAIILSPSNQILNISLFNFVKYQMEIVGTGWALWPSPSSFNLSISNK